MNVKGIELRATSPTHTRNIAIALGIVAVVFLTWAGIETVRTWDDN
jgi:peroxiredoxin family protein